VTHRWQDSYAITAVFVVVLGGGTAIPRNTAVLHHGTCQQIKVISATIFVGQPVYLQANKLGVFKLNVDGYFGATDVR